jgi:tetrahydromethanopterin S-methyltransferase subunit G
MVKYMRKKKLNKINKRLEVIEVKLNIVVDYILEKEKIESTRLLKRN